MTLSTISRQIARLEDRLGVQLVARTTHALRLTEEGQLLYDHSARGLDELEKGIALVSQLRAEPRGVLRIITTTCFGKLHILPAILDFLPLYPQVTIDVSLSHAEASFLGNRAEILIRSSPVRGKSIAHERLTKIRHVICATPEYLRAHSTPQIPSDLASHNCLIMTQPVTASDWPFKRGAHKQLVPVSGNFRADTMEALYRGVMKNLGIARIPNYVVGPELKSGQLVSLFDNATSEAVMNAHYLKGRYPDLKTQAFVGFLRQRFQANYDWEQRNGAL